MPASRSRQGKVEVTSVSVSSTDGLPGSKVGHCVLTPPVPVLATLLCLTVSITCVRVRSMQSNLFFLPGYQF